jgi:hypothetical protein
VHEGDAIQFSKNTNSGSHTHTAYTGTHFRLGSGKPGSMSLGAVQQTMQSILRRIPNAPQITVEADASAYLPTGSTVVPKGGTMPDGRGQFHSGHMRQFFGITRFGAIGARALWCRYDHAAKFTPVNGPVSRQFWRPASEVPACRLRRHPISNA